MLKTLLLSLFLLTVLFGCSRPVEGTTKYDVSGRYLGMTTSDLMQVKGAPGAVAVLPTGESVWTYKALMTTEPAPSGTARRVTKWVETTSFVIDSGGRVKSYTTAVEQ